MLVKPVANRSSSGVRLRHCDLGDGATVVVSPSGNDATTSGRRSVKRESGQRDEEIQRRADFQRAVKAGHFDEQQRQGRSGDRAQHIRHIEKAEGSRRFLAEIVLDRQHGDRDGRAHQGAPGDQGQRHPGSGGQVVRPGGRPAGVLQQCATPAQFVRDDDGGDADQQLGEGVEAQRARLHPVAIAADEAATAPRAQSQSGHEHGEHDGDQGAGDTELSHRQAQPDDLVEKAAKAGEEEEAEEPAQAADGALSRYSAEVDTQWFPSRQRCFREQRSFSRHLHF